MTDEFSPDEHILPDTDMQVEYEEISSEEVDQAVAAYLSIKGRTLDAEDTGRLALVPTGRTERSEDGSAFQVGERDRLEASRPG